jgi:seryl-tRNA synthetase
MNAAEETNIIQLSTNDPAQSYAPSQEPVSPGNIEKIRDILFGAQMRDYDRRFGRLEEKLLKETADLREETRRRFDSLENFIKQEIAALSDRVKAENQQSSQASEEITRELRDTARSIGQKINQLDEQTANQNRELREHILAQSKDLAEELRRKHDEISAALSREARELRNDKADRTALANLFTELAMRLNNEFKLPGDE